MREGCGSQSTEGMFQEAQAPEQSEALAFSLQHLRVPPALWEMQPGPCVASDTWLFYIGLEPSKGIFCNVG